MVLPGILDINADVVRVQAAEPLQDPADHLVGFLRIARAYDIQLFLVVDANLLEVHLVVVLLTGDMNVVNLGALVRCLTTRTLGRWFIRYYAPSAMAALTQKL